MTHHRDTLILPDVHHHIDEADAMLGRFEGGFEQVVLLGDSFDSFGDSSRMTTAACRGGQLIGMLLGRRNAAPGPYDDAWCWRRDRAIEQRRPPPGLLHHFDRGSQYVDDDYVKALGRPHR